MKVSAGSGAGIFCLLYTSFAARNPVYSIAFVGLTVAIVANEVARLFRGYKALAPSQVTALINQENALVVDLRAAGDFQAGHIAGSKNVQMAQFDPENKHLAPAKALPVVLVCNCLLYTSRCV